MEKTGVIYGCEVPRIYTPPLRELTPDTTLGYEVIEFAENVLHISLLPWQKWLVIHALEIIDDPADHEWTDHTGPKHPTIDHIIPMSKGGGHVWDNVQVAHAICNSIKRDSIEVEAHEAS